MNNGSLHDDDSDGRGAYEMRRELMRDKRKPINHTRVSVRTGSGDFSQSSSIAKENWQCQNHLLKATETLNYVEDSEFRCQ